MPEVEIYSSLFCPYCTRAKRLLSGKGVAYKEIEVDWDADLRRRMTERADGRETVPQIFIDGAHVGGADDLAELDRTGRLDAMLGLA